MIYEGERVLCSVVRCSSIHANAEFTNNGGWVRQFESVVREKYRQVRGLRIELLAAFLRKQKAAQKRVFHSVGHVGSNDIEKAV